MASPALAVQDLVRYDDGVVSARVFSDPDVYQLEIERLFPRTWLFVAHESEIPNPGDFVTRHMGADPVIVTAVFQFNCRDRESPATVSCGLERDNIKS